MKVIWFGRLYSFICKGRKFFFFTYYSLGHMGESLSFKFFTRCKLFNIMAKNGTSGDGHRNGQVTGRSQFEHNGHYYKRDTDNGRIISVKSDDTPYKGIRKEK